jgi:hypothetical protein
MADNANLSLRGANPEGVIEIAEISKLGWRDAHLGFVPQQLAESRTDESFRARGRSEPRIGDHKAPSWWGDARTESPVA